ncbi:MAG: SemiSWEET transporter [Bacilli bacterium]|jgi:MtN3 and saliva related transmembrane protein
MSEFLSIGLIAGFFTTLGYTPQIVKGYRTGRMDDVSILMPLLLMIGLGLWLIYGLVMDDFPIIFWNAIAVVFNFLIIVMKLHYDKKSRGAEKLPPDEDLL